MPSSRTTQEWTQKKTEMGFREKVQDKHMLCPFYAEIKAIGEGVFDVALCNMVLMDMPTIQILLAGLHHALKVQIYEEDPALVMFARQQIIICCSCMPHVCLLNHWCFDYQSRARDTLAAYVVPLHGQ